MKDMWAIYPGLIDKETCYNIILSANKIKERDAGVSNDGGVNKEVRRSKVRWVLPENEDFKEVFQFINNKFHEANTDHFGVDIAHLKSLQFTTYAAEDEGHYDWHVDVFWETPKFYQRKLSMVIQLSDEYSYGHGDLEVEHNIIPNRDELRKRGTVFIFPSFLKHRVTPVSMGIRHSLVAWIEGPNWR